MYVPYTIPSVNSGGEMANKWQICGHTGNIWSLPPLRLTSGLHKIIIEQTLMNEAHYFITCVAAGSQKKEGEKSTQQKMWKINKLKSGS